MNKIFLIGRLTAAPEAKSIQTEAGHKNLVNFTLAVDRKYKKNEADFIRCVAWEKTAEFISKYFGKGSKIAVVGRLETDTYEKNGQKFYSSTVRVEEVEFADSKKKEEAPNTPEGDGFISIPEGIEAELPFK